MKAFSEIVLFITISVLSACNPVSKIEGTYVLEKNNVLAMKLTLNPEGSFVQLISERHCQGNWYFGFYSVKNKTVYLSPVSFQPDRLWKNDTIVYYTDTALKKRGLFVNDNGRRAADNAAVFINNNFWGKTDNTGYIELPAAVPIDSLTIKTTTGLPKTLQVGKKPYNLLFAVVYDYGLEPCGDLYFQKEFKIRNNKLEIGRNNSFIKGNNSGYLYKNIITKKQL